MKDDALCGAQLAQRLKDASSSIRKSCRFKAGRFGDIITHKPEEDELE